MIRNIPNFISLLNLFSGCIAVIFAIQGQLVYAAYFVFIGIFFDFFDGLAARLLKVPSDLGKQLDSLADVITSGFAPGVVMLQLLHFSIQGNSYNLFDFEDSFSIIPLLGLLITGASAYRLAKFNIDTRQSNSFIGLPTPANAIFILSLPLILYFSDNAFAKSLISNTYFLLATIAFSVFMLNAPIHLLSFKKGLKNKQILFLISISVILIAVLQVLALPIIIMLYVFISFLAKK